MQEVETVDIILVKRQGRFSGEAFVVLPGMVQVEFALNKHKAYMGKRYVEVQQASKEVSTSLLVLTVAHRMRGVTGVEAHLGWLCGERNTLQCL